MQATAAPGDDEERARRLARERELLQASMREEVARFHAILDKETPRRIQVLPDGLRFEPDPAWRAFFVTVYAGVGVTLACMAALTAGVLYWLLR